MASLMIACGQVKSKHAYFDNGMITLNFAYGLGLGLLGLGRVSGLPSGLAWACLAGAGLGRGRAGLGRAWQGLGLLGLLAWQGQGRAWAYAVIA
jgi:hypothetical protein